MTALTQVDLATVVDLERRRRQAMLDADIDTLRTLIDPDAVYVHSSGHRESGDTIIRKISDGGTDYQELLAADESASLVGGVVIITYRQDSRVKVRAESLSSTSVCTAVWANATFGSPALVCFHSAAIGETA